MEDMNKKVGMVAAAAAVCITAMAATEKAALKEATIFLNGAELHHEATLTLQKGENQVVIEGMSPVIDRNSLQLSLTGGVVISSFEYGQDYLSADKQNSNTKQLTEQCEQKEKEKKQIEAEMQTLEETRKLLQTGLQHSMSVERQNITSEQIEKNLTYYEQRSAKISTQKAALEKRLQDINKEITRLQAQIRQDGMQGAKRSGVLTLSLNSPQAGKQKLQVKYFTSRAHWTPFYDLNVTEVGSPVSFVMKAQVGQTTGLDWEKVRLTLSTGTPSKSNQIPQFSTWYVRRYVPQTTYASNAMYSRSLKKEAMPMMEMAMEDAMIEEDAEQDVTVERFIQTSEQTLSVEYAIDLPYTILGNGKEQTIGLRTIEAKDVDYKYYAAPKLDGAVYLTAQVKNWNTLGLLSGTANLTFAGTYYGQTFINTESTDEAITLTLGQDPQISVKREKAQDYQKKSGVLGNKKTETKAYKIIVRNNKQQPINLRLQEQYPVSTNSEIEVTLTSKTTRPTEKQENSGLLTYEIELQAGETKEIIVEYQLVYPKDWTLQ